MAFNAYQYFNTLRTQLKLTRAKTPEEQQAGAVEYVPCRITGIDSMEDILTNMRTAEAFFGIDDTNDGVTVQQGGGYFDRRIYVIYILRKYDIRDEKKMELQEQALAECRKIYDSICTRLIKDRVALQNSTDLIYMRTDNIPYYEFVGYQLTGVTGLYMIVTVDHPKDLQYAADDWEQ